MPKRYPEEFRRKVLDLVAAGRPIAQIAADLNISDQTIYGWRKQELIDAGQLSGWGTRQVVGEVHRPRCLVVGDAGAGVVDELLGELS